MLTFEKVLKEFEFYLSQDDMFEVVITSRGYTVLGWDERAQDWCDPVFCGTPEALMKTLLNAHSNYWEANITNGMRDLTEKERRLLDELTQQMRNRCLSAEEISQEE